MSKGILRVFYGSKLYKSYYSEINVELPNKLHFISLLQFFFSDGESSYFHFKALKKITVLFMRILLTHIR